MKFLQWLKMVLRRFRAQGVHYIGGSDVLPPPLSAEEEAAAVEANSRGDVAARNRLIEHNLRLVVFLARKFESSGVGTEDLISIGTIGLIKAVSTYRSDKNVKLATYASRCIENEILMHLRKIAGRRSEVSIDEPLSSDWDGNELLLMDVLTSDDPHVGEELERRAERAAAAGDTATVEQIVNQHIPRWSRGILKVTGVSLSVEGLENIPKDRPCVFVANHRSYYDIPLLLAGLEKPHGILAKEELEKIPLLNRWMKLLGCVFVQRDDVRASVRALNDATAIVEGGRSFVIFPEGTRYKGEEGGAGEFKAGAFRIAVKTGAPVVPVAVTGARALFETNGNRCRPGSVRIKIMSPIQTAGMSKAEQKQLPDAVRQSILAALK